MLLFENKINKTLIDVPNKVSALIHTINGCNLKCHKCHNYEDIVNFKGNPFTENDIIEKMKLNGYMFDNIILSGGEIMLNPSSLIISFLTKLKEVYTGKIIVYTNGFYYHNIKELYESGLVDDWYMDIKFPYHMEVDEANKDIYEEILGIKYNKQDIVNVLKSIELLSDYNFRTVQYPQYNDQIFDELVSYINKNKLKHQFNKFVEL